MNVRHAFLIALLILLPVVARAQDYKVLDSINNVIRTLPRYDVTAYFDDLHWFRLTLLPFEDALKEANYRVDYCKKNNLSKALVHAYQNLGGVYNKNNAIAEATKCYQMAVDLAREINDQESLMKSHMVLGNFQRKNNLYEEGLKNILIGVKIAENISDTTNYYSYQIRAMAVELQLEGGNFKLVTEMGPKLIALFNKVDTAKFHRYDVRSCIVLYNSIAAAYGNFELYDSALINYDRSAHMAHRLGEEYMIALTGGNKASIYMKLGRYDEALPKMNAYFRMSEKYKEWASAIQGAISLADIHLHKGNISLAETYLDSGVYLTKNYTPNGALPTAYWQTFGDIEYAKGNFRAAHDAHQKYTTDRLVDIRKQESAKVANVRSAYDFERKQNEIETLTKNEKIQEGQLKTQRIILTATAIVMALAILLAINFIYNYRRQKKVTLLISTQHDEIVKAHEQINVAYSNLQIAQSQLVQTEKMAFLGRLTSGVAHEINTPLGAIKASSQNAEASIDSIIVKLDKVSAAIPAQHVPMLFELIRQSTRETTHLDSRERRALRKKTASGLIALGIKNEDTMAEILVNLGIAGNLQKWESLLRLPHATDVFQLVDEAITLKNQNLNINAAVGRASKILFALKTYSHQGGDEEAIDVDIAENIDMVLSIYSSNLKQTEVIKKFDTVPAINAYPDELSQVWTNLIHNSLQAMNGQGKLGISISQGQNEVKVEVTDTGGGISPENQKNIFEPFFTTKAAGEGTGLGLSIVRKIVDKHNGRIEFESELMKGTTFRIFLPLPKKT